jgi:formylglycine-generating enzyme required for sulfatase activity
MWLACCSLGWLVSLAPAGSGGASAGTPGAAAVKAAAHAQPPDGRPEAYAHAASGITLRLIPAGGTRPPFYIGVTEVTTGQFRRFVEATAYRTDAERGVDDGNGHGRGSFTAGREGNREWSTEANWRSAFHHFPEFRLADDTPALHLSWNDAHAFAEHYGLRLPTEAEWEHAARAGQRAAWPWGDTPAGGAAHANVRDRTAAHFAQPERAFPFDDGVLLVAPAGSFRPNAWGLHDTVGNLAEWVEDRWAPGSDARVIRGGSWYDEPDGASLAARAAMHPAARRDFIGFRVALSVERVVPSSPETRASD